MSKVLGSWSGMRKYPEEELLAESLRGRVRYGCTSFVGMDGCRIFDISIDGKQVKRFSPETVNTYFIDNGYTTNKDPRGVSEYRAEFRQLLARYPLLCRTEYTDEEFGSALAEYRNQHISESLASENPLIRMFAVLDRRVGKRTLVRLKETAPDQPAWLEQFYRLRFEADGV